MRRCLCDDDDATIDDGDATIDDDNVMIDDDNVMIDDGNASDDANAHTACGTEQYAPTYRTPCHAPNRTPHVQLYTFKWST